LNAAQERGTLFINPGEPVYAGMVIGYSPKSEDLVVNICKENTLQTPVHQVVTTH